MFEQETDTIISTIRQRTIGGRETIAVKDILASDIPHAIKSFFRADVETMLLAEIRAYRKSSRFLFDHPEIQGLQNQINSILVLHFTFNQSEFLGRLNDAVHMMINFLIRPQWTMTNVVFEKEKTISTQALVGLVRYFGPYEYLREIIIQYVKDKDVSSMAKSDFSQLVWRVDGQYIRRKSGDELARIMSPMFDFFDFPKNTGSVAMPIKALIKFFEDKGLTSVISQLEGEAAQGKTALTQRELAELLEGVRRTSGAFDTQKIEVDQKDLIETSVTHHTEAPTGETPAGKIDFISLIGENDRRRFVKKIFNQDEEAFLSTLLKMGTVSTWREASRLIDETLIIQDIDPYSPDVERFIEIVFQQYHPKKSE